MRTLLPKRAYTVSVDLADAYWNLRVSRPLSSYLGFRLQKTMYVFKAMPFGLNIAPRIFTKLPDTVVQQLRLEGIQIAAYLDDWLVWAASKTVCLLAATMVIQFLDHRGFKINYKNSNRPSAESTTEGCVRSLEKIHIKRLKRSTEMDTDLTAIASKDVLKGQEPSKDNSLTTTSTVDLSNEIFNKIPKACTRLKPATFPKPLSWSLDKVLHYALNLNNEDCTLKDLTQKVIFLFAIASGARVSEIVALSRNEGHIQITEEEELNLFPDHTFLTKNEQPTKRADPDSTPAGHNRRKVASSLNFFRHMDFDRLRSFTGWKSSRVFYKHYAKKVHEINHFVVAAGIQDEHKKEVSVDSILSDFQDVLENKVASLPTLVAARLQRWAIKLAAYLYNIDHRPTAKMGNVDALSMFPVDKEPEKYDESILLISVCDVPNTAKDIAHNTKKDPILSMYEGVISLWITNTIPNTCHFCLMAGKPNEYIKKAPLLPIEKREIDARLVQLNNSLHQPDGANDQQDKCRENQCLEGVTEELPTVEFQITTPQAP
ncbi:uncharacterized protein [Palaemon carinicauda]|uniref:uncharacterized protein n=1 Tax=Palaemon carinicauda TaxID=392227 RepID=UPI0035B584EF